MCYTFTVVISRFLLPPFLLFFYFSDISAHAFITHIDPSEVSVEERQLAEGEPKLLDVTRDRVVLLSPPPHDHAEDGAEVHDCRGDGQGQVLLMKLVMVTKMIVMLGDVSLFPRSGSAW